MRKSHFQHLAFLFSNFLNMSLAFNRIYKTIYNIRPSFHLIEFNKQIVLFSCKFEKKIALFRLGFPCLPRLPLRQRKFVKSRGKYKLEGQGGGIPCSILVSVVLVFSDSCSDGFVPVVPVVSFRLFQVLVHAEPTLTT